MTSRTETLPRDLRLEHKALYSLPDAAGLALTCHEGVVWLTVDGDPRDFVLEAGETFETPERSRVLIYALARSRVSIVASTAVAVPAPRRGLHLAPRLSAAGQS